MNETLTEELSKGDVAEVNSDRYVKTEEAQKAQDAANQFYTDMKNEEIANAQEESATIKADEFHQKIKDAVKDKDLSAITRLIPAITNKGRRLIGADEQLVRDIKELSDISVRNSILDAIYPGIENTDLFRDVVKARFKVSVGVDKLTNEDMPDGYRNERYEYHYAYLYQGFIKQGLNEKNSKKYAAEYANKYADQDTENWASNMQTQYAARSNAWPKDALVHLYNSYLRIPQAQLDLLKVVMSRDSERESRGAGGGCPWCASRPLRASRPAHRRRGRGWTWCRC